MSKRDYHVYACLILSYLRECLINSKKVDLEYLYNLEDVDEPYWQYIYKHLLDDGYIEGVILIPILGKSEKQIKLKESVQITPKGVEYLNDSTTMAKAKKILKEIKDTVPWL